MKEFEKHWDFTGLSEHVNYHPDVEGPEYIQVPGINRKEERREGWRAALDHFNKLFLKGMHPQDVVFEIQKELEE